LGYEPQDWLGCAFAELFVPEDRDRIYQLVFSGRAADAVHLEVRALRKDDTEAWLDLAITFVMDGDRLESIQGIARDVSERKATETKMQRLLDDLARSNMELEQFAYVASHDLQEPLRMVASYVQLLARRYGEQLDSDAGEFIAFAVDGATRMQTLINDLLAYSRVGSQGKAPEAMEMQDALDVALQNLGAAIEAAGATVTHDPLPHVMADPGQMIQLLQNLIGNAVKFRTEVAPQVHISAHQDGETWVFGVHDNGIGIDAQYVARIFIIFQRLHGRGDYPGTGIGLAICKRIAERHRGRMWVESEPGKGSHFFFTIPV
jgi:two-component system, chemotaxis family, sensor kinase Cph1